MGEKKLLEQMQFAKREMQIKKAIWNKKRKKLTNFLLSEMVEKGTETM